MARKKTIGANRFPRLLYIRKLHVSISLEWIVFVRISDSIQNCRNVNHLEKWFDHTILALIETLFVLSVSDCHAFQLEFQYMKGFAFFISFNVRLHANGITNTIHLYWHAGYSILIYLFHRANKTKYTKRDMQL